MVDLVRLDEDECWKRLRMQVVGRVGFDLGHGPRIHPVNYRVESGRVLVRTSEESELARFVDLFGDGALLAFEVDEVDYSWHHGWSVLVAGRPRKVTDPDEAERLRDAWPEPWAPGERGYVLVLEPVEVTGRLLGAA